MGAASSPRAFFRTGTRSFDKENASILGWEDTYDTKYGGGSKVGTMLAANVAGHNERLAALKAPDLTDQIIKSVAAAELKRKKMGATRESMFVSERPSPSQMDADRKKNPALNQYTPKPKPPGGA